MNYKHACIAVVILLLLVCGPALARQERNSQKPLVGRWQIVATKEPGKPYREGYKGRPFVTKGPNAFTLIMEYNEDGTFRRITRIGDTETVHKGEWSLDNHVLHQRRQDRRSAEVIYVRFDDPNHYTITEVYEGTPDPGIFARFRRLD